MNHVYHPLAASSGQLLTLLRALKARGGDQKAKLFQFLNKIGAPSMIKLSPKPDTGRPWYPLDEADRH